VGCEPQPDAVLMEAVLAREGGDLLTLGILHQTDGSMSCTVQNSTRQGKWKTLNAFPTYSIKQMKHALHTAKQYKTELWEALSVCVWPCCHHDATMGHHQVLLKYDSITSVQYAPVLQKRRLCPERTQRQRILDEVWKRLLSRRMQNPTARRVQETECPLGQDGQSCACYQAPSPALQAGQGCRWTAELQVRVKPGVRISADPGKMQGAFHCCYAFSEAASERKHQKERG